MSFWPVDVYYKVTLCTMLIWNANRYWKVKFHFYIILYYVKLIILYNFPSNVPKYNVRTKSVCVQGKEFSPVYRVVLVFQMFITMKYGTFILDYS
jgi:hypothetical protein